MINNNKFIYKIFLFFCFIAYIFIYPVSDSSDIEYSISRLFDPLDNIYYNYINFFSDIFISFINIDQINNYELNSKYQRFLFSSQYIEPFNALKLFFFLVNLPFFIIFVFFLKRVFEKNGIHFSLLYLFAIPGGVLIFSSPSLDAPLVAITGLSLYLLSSNKFLWAIFSIIFYYYIFDDKGAVSLIIFFFIYILMKISFLQNSLVLLFTFILSMILPSGAEIAQFVISIFDSRFEILSNYHNLIESTIGFGSYPILVFILSLGSTTSLAFTNYVLVLFILFNIALNKNFIIVNQNLSRIFYASCYSFIVLTWIFPSIAQVRHHPYFLLILYISISFFSVRNIYMLYFITIIFSIAIFFYRLYFFL